MAYYDSIKLEKGMYGVSGKSFSSLLEELDPSSNYEGSPLGELDAFQRQLKRFDIKVGGADSDMVEKFFQTTDSSALFPEFVSRAVRTGIEEANVLPLITATTTKIDRLDYRSISSAPADNAKELKTVGEGAAIPKTVITTNENLVRLTKKGRMLVSSYEAIKFQRLDLFAVTLKQIGSYIARTQLREAIEVIVNGDGNNNPAAESETAEAETLDYGDLITFWADFYPYKLTTMLVSADVMQQLLQITELKDPKSGLNFQATGQLITPLGANLIISNSVAPNTIIGLDKTAALELVEASGVEVDYDRLIDRQLERSAITVISGFAKIFSDASRLLKIKTEL